MANTLAKEAGGAADEYKAAYSVDLLFGTDCASEPGSMRVEVVPPKNGSTLSVVVTITSGASVTANAESIAKVLQKEIFSRLRLDVLKPSDAVLYFSSAGQAGPEFSGCRYAKAVYEGGGFSYEKADAVWD
ncbi:MAG: hypothetical protein LBL83_13975 [Clostridiales bacterium]|jgi:hypothetical protein|nr:hypothetical protein [Clostridiales bacterium]